MNSVTQFKKPFRCESTLAAIIEENYGNLVASVVLFCFVIVVFLCEVKRLLCNWKLSPFTAALRTVYISGFLSNPLCSL